MEYLKTQVYKPYTDNVDSTQMIPSSDKDTHHSYKLSLSNCDNIEISTDLESPTCEQPPNKDIYFVRFNKFKITVTCKWASTEYKPFWFNDTCSGLIYTKRDLYVKFRFNEGHNSTISTYLTHGDVVPENHHDDSIHEFTECNNCKSYNKA